MATTKNDSEVSLGDYESSTYAKGARDAYSQDAVDTLVAEIKRLLGELDTRDAKIDDLESELEDVKQARDVAEKKVERLEEDAE